MWDILDYKQFPQYFTNKLFLLGPFLIFDSKSIDAIQILSI